MDEWSKARLTLVYAAGGAVLLAIFLLTVEPQGQHALARSSPAAAVRSRATPVALCVQGCPSWGQEESHQRVRAGERLRWRSSACPKSPMPLP